MTLRPLEGRAALITGASQGLGLGIARAYAAAGASVFLCARDAAMVEQARADVAALAAPGQTVLARAADVSRPDDVAAVARAAIAAFPHLDILVNNAGVQGPMGALEEVAWDAWVHAISINLLGSVACCRALVPHMKARGAGKIVQLSGGGATTPMPRMSAYAASKAGVVRFMETLAQEVRAHRIDVNAVAPGAVNTRMLDDVLAAGPERIGRERYERALKQKAEGGASVDRAAALAVFLASRASDGITGKLISAVWDPWETLDAHRADLAQSDVYTLRRITPTDRGFPWGKS
jgi:NAD(P)-dependent dehydrogenase (short-subunit alcohol dehydrogenase family)